MAGNNTTVGDMDNIYGDDNNPSGFHSGVDISKIGENTDNLGENIYLPT